MLLIARFRSLAYHRQHGRCFYCHAPMWSADPSEFAKQYGVTIHQAVRLRCTAEHLRARQDGGDDSPDNIVAVCLHCNNARHRKKLPPSPGHVSGHRSDQDGQTQVAGRRVFSSRSLVSAILMLNRR